jgi:hypothetical protein
MKGASETRGSPGLESQSPEEDSEAVGHDGKQGQEGVEADEEAYVDELHNGKRYHLIRHHELAARMELRPSLMELRPTRVGGHS